MHECCDSLNQLTVKQAINVFDTVVAPQNHVALQNRRFLVTALQKVKEMDFDIARKSHIAYNDKLMWFGRNYTDLILKARYGELKPHF